ncbi:hypothetical protein LTSEMIS_3291, partial [Salmonella enterica subsp. enterica serovar Mississippi str. A4-633]
MALARCTPAAVESRPSMPLAPRLQCHYMID